MKTSLFASCLLLACLPATHAAMVFTDNVPADIPDGSSSGLVKTLTITGTSQTIASIQVSLEIAARPGDEAFLGDLYVYLTNGSITAVLLNRPGRTSTESAGYDDNQSLDVTFSDDASDDIHTYRATLNGNNATPIISPLTGTWLPDGRTSDPAAVLDTDAPSARLSGFIGANVDGEWNLFVADMSGGAEHRVVSWSMTIEAVPEPSALLLGGAALPLLLRRRRPAAAGDR